MNDYKMGKKGSWFSALKKFASGSEKKDKDKSKKKRFQKEESVDVISFSEQSPLYVPAESSFVEDYAQPENEPSELAHSEALDLAVAEAQLVVEVEQPPCIISCMPEMSEETAAVMIQSAFRGYMAKKALRGLKALMRLRLLVQGPFVKRQVASNLKSMQTLSRVNSEIRARRIRMSEENHALQRQLCNKHEKDLEKLKTPMDGNWNHSTKSKAQIEATLLNKQEAAIRREKALAYAYSHQRHHPSLGVLLNDFVTIKFRKSLLQTWRNSLKATTPAVMDPNNPHWGWSWLERWMAARPWEPQSTSDHPDHVSVTSVATRASVVDIIQIYARRDQNSPTTKPSPRIPTNQKSSQLHRHQSLSIPKASSSSSRIKKTNVTNSRVDNSWGGDDDTRSTVSVKSKLSRRHTIVGSSCTDDVSLASSPSVSSYTTPPKDVKARSRLTSSSVAEKKGQKEKGYASAGSAKKRLSLTTSPAKPRRLSSPAIVNTS